MEKMTTSEFERLIEETQDERKKRRETLKIKYRSETEKLSMPWSIDVRMLKGSILTTKKSALEIEDIPNIIFNQKEIINRLRTSMNRTKAYTQVFYRKAEFLIKMLSDLLENYGLGIKAKCMLYSRLNLNLDGYYTILKKSKNFKEVDPVLRNTFYQRKSNSMKDNITEPESELDDVVNNALSNFSCNKRDYSRGHKITDEKMSENEKTREQMLQLYGLIMYNNKKILDILKDHRSLVKNRLKQITGSGECRDLINLIIKLSEKFSTCFSWIMNSLVHSFESYSSKFSIETNPYLIEFLLCSTIRRFRESLDNRVINLIYEINQDLELKLTKHQEFIDQSLHEFNEMGSNLFYGWDFEKLQNERLRITGDDDTFDINNINICDLLSNWSKIFLRKKLGMLPVHKILNEDVMDFFRYYEIKFNSESLLLITYLKCFRYDIKRGDCIEGFLCADVKKKIILTKF